MRPAIRPGAAVLRRDRDHLQIGTSPGYVIRDRPGLIHVLRRLDGRRAVETLEQTISGDVADFTGDLGEIIAELHAAGAVCDANVWDIPGKAELSEYARFLTATGCDPDLLRRANGHRAGLIHDKSTSSLATTIADVLGRSGVETTTATDTDLAIILSLGEPGRETFAAAMHLGVDHLPVVVDEERVRIGPLVRPGQTPCMHCYDLHRSDWDRGWPALSTQFGRPSQTIATPAAISPAVTHVAAAEVGANVVAHLLEERSPMQGQLIAVGPGHDERARWPLHFHPGCGCALLRVA